MRTFTTHEAHDLVFPAMCSAIRFGHKELFHHVVSPAEHQVGDKIVVIETKFGVTTGREIHGIVTKVDSAAAPPNPEKAAECGRFPNLQTILACGLTEVRFSQIEMLGFTIEPYTSEEIRNSVLAFEAAAA